MSHTTTAVAVVLLMVLAACGDDARGAQGAGTETGQTHSTGVPIATGEYPFNALERCYEGAGSDDREPTHAVGCGTSTAPLAGAGTVFHSDGNFTIAYRGGAVIRDEGPDSSNPETVRAIVVLDVTIPADEYIEVNHNGFEELRLTARTASEYGDKMTSCGVAPVDESEEGRFGYSLIRLDQPETFTVLHCFIMSGPESFVGGDPYVRVGSWIDTESEGNHEAYLAVLDQDTDDDALPDVRDSILRVAELTGSTASEAGIDWFDRVFGSIVEAGEPLGSSDRRTGGDGQAGAGFDAPPEESTSDTFTDGPADDTVEPPPPPSPPPPPDEDDLVGQGQGAGGYAGDTDSDTDADGDGVAWRAEDYIGLGPSRTDDTWVVLNTLLYELADGKPLPGCDGAAPGATCVKTTRHTQNGDYQETVGWVRFNTGGDPDRWDAVLLLETSNWEEEGWYITDAWVPDDGDRPAWVE